MDQDKLQAEIRAIHGLVMEYLDGASSGAFDSTSATKLAMTIYRCARDEYASEIARSGIEERADR
jgi:hypothetical protein